MVQPRFSGRKANRVPPQGEGDPPRSGWSDGGWSNPESAPDRNDSLPRKGKVALPAGMVGWGMVQPLNQRPIERLPPPQGEGRGGG